MVMTVTNSVFESYLLKIAEGGYDCRATTCLLGVTPFLVLRAVTLD